MRYGKQTISRVLILFVILNSFILTLVSGNYTPNVSETNKKLEKVNYDGIIVKYKKREVNLGNAIGYIKAMNFARSNNLEIVENEKKLNLSLLDTKHNSVNLDDLINRLKANPLVEHAQPNYIYEPLDLSEFNDTHKDKLWGLYNNGQEILGQVGYSGSDISWDKAIGVFFGTGNTSVTGVIVAVLDTGIAYNHPDIINNMWDGTDCLDHEGNYLGGCKHGYDYDNDDKDPIVFKETHGTHVAGIIAASLNNSKGIIGVNPNAKIMSLKHEKFTTMSIVKSINFARYNGAKIINASFGGYGFIDLLMYNAIKEFGSSGGLFIAAAGNQGKNHDLGGLNRMFPSGYGVDNVITGMTLTGLANIISVAATDNRDNLASFSDYGRNTVSIGAPGVSIYSTVQGTGKTIGFLEDFSGAYFTGNTYSFITGGVNNNFGSKLGLIGLWGDINTPFLTGSTGSYIEKEIDISSFKIPVLSFNVWCDAGKGNPYNHTDYLELSFSTGGSFELIDRIDYYNQGLYNPYVINSHAGYYGRLSYDLSDYISSNFKFRFTWISDNEATDDLGCLIFGDSNYPFEVVGLDDGTQESYSYLNGTSMAAPYVSGLASLAWSYRPDLSYLDIKNAILQNGDDISSLSGRTTTGKRINAYKTLLSITPPDYTPDPFSFLTLTGQPLNTLVESNEIIVSGINTGATISVIGGEYKIGTGAYTTETGVVYSGDTVKVRHLTSNQELSSVSTILTIGDLTGTFITITGIIPDDVPDQFTFNDLVRQPLNTLVESNEIIVSGINTGATISVIGGEYKIGTGAYTTETGVVYSGDTVRVRHITSQFNVTDTNTTLTIGGISDTFTSKTYIEQKQVNLFLSDSGVTLTGNISVGSGFDLIGEAQSGDIFTFTGGQIFDLLTGSILEGTGISLADIIVEIQTNLYSKTGTLNFEKKIISGEEKINGNVKQIFTGAVRIGSDYAILLDRPAIIKYLLDKSASKAAYRKTGTLAWTLIDIENGDCSLDIIIKPVCAYKVGNNIYIKTYHFTDFSLVKEEVIANSSPGNSGGGGGGGGSGGGGGGGGGILMDYCPNGDHSSSRYDGVCLGISNNPTRNSGASSGVERYKEHIKDFKNGSSKNKLNKKSDLLKVKKVKYGPYEILYISGYRLSEISKNIALKIINSKSIKSQDKFAYLRILNNYLEARYNFDSASIKPRELRNKLVKQQILIKNVFKKIIKNN